MTAKPTSKDGRKGPASYFSSIEQTYGKPIDHWLALARTRTDDKHMDVVNWLSQTRPRPWSRQRDRDPRTGRGRVTDGRSGL